MPPGWPHHESPSATDLVDQADNGADMATASDEFERRLRMMLDIASDVVFELGPDLSYRWVSPSVTEVLGWQPDDLVGRSAEDLIHPDDLPEVLAARQSPIRTPAIAARYLTLDGEYRWLSGRSRELRDADGVMLGRIVGLHDSQEQVLAQQALAASEEKFRLLAENASDVVVHERDGVVRWVSPSVTEGLGWSADAWIGHRLNQFAHPDDTHEVDTWTSSDQPIGAEVGRARISTQNGSYRWVEARARPFRSSSGALDGTVLSLRTVDAQVAAEEQLRQRARLDPLTGLLNRSEALELLVARTSRPRRTGPRFAVAFCDLDGFKEINDSRGHAVGDQLLRTVAARMIATVRSGDIVARFGGDELLIALDGVHDLADAVRIAEAVRIVVAEPINTSGEPVTTTVSIGVTLAEVGEDIDSIIARADQAMYRAKSEGRNRVVAVSA